MGCAIGLSLASIVELIYWMFVKPFGWPRSTCRNCLKSFKTHYPSRTVKSIANFITKSAIALYLAYAVYRLYWGFERLYINPPQPEEFRNQIVQKPKPLFDFLNVW